VVNAWASAARGYRTRSSHPASGDEVFDFEWTERDPLAPSTDSLGGRPRYIVIAAARDRYQPCDRFASARNDNFATARDLIKQ